ncbi:MAG: hypothetical protein DCC75_09610 [Proteobacteria bacterium]|nr:MAG: hypothetical protein DCC75_09610 [Pseudomonadota bacterium]
MLLGEASLEAGKVDAAYASAQAILQLRPGDSRGLFLLARSHLRASQHDSALALFQKLQQHRSKALPRSLLAEETAACYMARGDNARAQEILAGETNLSAAGRMALEFCRGRTSRT